jgi:hypothetical protein
MKPGKSMSTQSEQDRRFREMLEARSVPDARTNIVSGLNRVAADDMLQRSAVDLLAAFRAVEPGGAGGTPLLKAAKDADRGREYELRRQQVDEARERMRKGLPVPPQMALLVTVVDEKE